MIQLAVLQIKGRQCWGTMLKALLDLQYMHCQFLFNSFLKLKLGRKVVHECNLEADRLSLC